jgi:hypothetical protein
MRIASRCTDEELVVPVGSQGRRNAFLDCDSAPLDGLARNCPGPAARRIVVEEENDPPNRARNGNPAKLFASKGSPAGNSGQESRCKSTFDALRKAEHAISRSAEPHRALPEPPEGTPCRRYPGKPRRV